MRGLALFAAILGCSPAEDPAPAEEPYTPAPYIYEEDAPPVATLDATALEDAIEAAIARAPSLNASPIFPAYALAMAGAESGCPAYYDYQGNQYWYDQCTTAGGAEFSGYSFYISYEDYDDGSGVPYDGAGVSGVAEIVTPDGHTFQAGGSAYNLVQTFETYTVYYSSIHGAFAWDGPGAEGTWLADGVAPDLDMYALASSYGNFLQLDGGFSGLGGEVDTVVFDTAVIFDGGLGSTCDTEPGGVVSVRDSDGSWYDVVFDGPAGWEDNDADPALCDGCGTGYFRGEPMGPVCVDFTPLLAFSGAPW